MKKAISLKYNSKTQNAPKVTAKGGGAVAEKIIEIARENDILIKEDPNLVEVLSKVEVDKEIPNHLYKAIAEVFKFLYLQTKDKKY